LSVKKILGVCLAVYGAPAISASESSMGVLFGQARLYSSDVNGEKQDSDSAGVKGVYFEHILSDPISVYGNFKKSEKLCFRDCYDFNASIDSIELSAKYSQTLTPWLNGFGRLGVNFYHDERMLGSWHLVHDSKKDSGFGAAAVIGLDFNPKGKFRVGLEYNLLSIHKSENLRTLSISIGTSL
jgi:opacity protein-like surface antigen